MITDRISQALFGTTEQQRYFDVQQPAYRLNRQLRRTGVADQRADLYDHLADIDDHLARIHSDVWGPDPIEHEGGRDVAESLASSADLLRRLADTERRSVAVARRELPPVPNVGEVAVAFLRDGMQGAELALWAELAVTTVRRHRASLMTRIWEFASERVGGQAAEVLACMAEAESRLAVPELPVMITRSVTRERASDRSESKVSGPVVRLAIASVFFAIAIIVVVSAL